MLKYLSLNFLLLLCSASIIREPEHKDFKQFENGSRDLEQIVEKWEPHVQDFLMLFDSQKLVAILFKYVNDPDVMNLVAFVGSSQFKDLVLDVESIEEFKEAVDFLESKGYEVNPIIELFNSLLALHEIPAELPTSNSKTVTNLIQEIIQALPIEEMKIMLKEKLETDPEVAKLLETLTSEEFKDILKRFSKNPKILEIKKIFESYGLNPKDLCSIFDDILNHNSNAVTYDYIMKQNVQGRRLGFGILPY